MQNYHIVKGWHNQMGGWILKEEKSNTMIIFSTTKEGIIHDTSAHFERTKEIASVKIHDENGKFQEERTYPRSADPKKSKG